MPILPLSLRRYYFLRERYSERAIARESGIPRIALYRLRVEQRPLPRDQDLRLRAFYERDAYRRLRDLGMSVTQARRFQWRIPEIVHLTEARMRDLTSRFTLGATKARTMKLERLGIRYDWREVFDEMMEKVKEGLRRSRKKIEDWEAGIT